MWRILLGVVVGVVLVPLALMAWLAFGKVPVAVADKPLPQEELVASRLLAMRIHRDKTVTPPIQADEDTLISGAQTYRDQCAMCHGFHGKPAQVGAGMYPAAPQLWEMHHHGNTTVMGVTDDPPDETHWKVANGIRLTGMPGYKNMLTETQMWQVSLLLANADKPLPPMALMILRGDASASQPPAEAPAKPAVKKK